MGCVSECGRFLLIILNVIFLFVGLGLIASGVLLKWFLGELLKSDVIKAMVESAFKEITKESAIPNTVEFGPLTQGAALALMVVGGVLFTLSFLACCGACCKWRPLLWLFAIFLVLFVIAEIVAFALLVTPNSPIHVNGKKALTETLHKSYSPQTDDPFTATVDLLMVTMKCCGIYGPEDFSNITLIYDVRGKDKETEVPPSCCKHRILQTEDFIDCAQNPTTNNTYQIGCYDAIFLKVEPWRPWMITGLVIAVLFQFVEVACAIQAAKANKVGTF